MVQKLLLAGLMTLAVNANAQTSPTDDAYFTVSRMQVKELSKTEAEAAVMASQTMNRTFANSVAIGATDCNQGGGVAMAARTSVIPSLSSVVGSATSTAPSLSDLTGIGAEIDQADIVLDKIINLGKKVWNLIDQGKPVVNVKSDIATALPQGAKCWTDLQNWQAPKYKVYAVSYKNAYGVTVVDFTYRVLFLTGGTVNGKGQYVGYASVEPLNINVLWGFHFNVEASVPTVYNMGSKADPVAGLNLQIKWTLDPILGLQHQEHTQTYFVSGRGEFKALQ